MPHDVEKIKLMNDFLGADPNFQKLPQLVKIKLKAFILKALMKLPCLPGLRLKHEVLLDEGLDLFLGGNPGDVLPNIEEGAVALELVLNELCEK